MVSITEEHDDEKAVLDDAGMQFEEVLSRVFPLPADSDTLQQLIDDTLNVQDEYYFKVSTPFVYLQLLSYAKMNDGSGSPFHTSQRELLFMVPLEWYEHVKASPEEKDHPGDTEADYRFNGKLYKLAKDRKASVTPFIFVDNELSVITGREEMGWQKGLMEIAQSDAGWVDTVQPKNRMVAINVRGLQRGGKSHTPKTLQLLEICRSPGFTLNFSTRSLTNQIAARLSEMKHVIDTQVLLAGYFLDTWRGLLGLGSDGHSPGSSPARIRHYLGSLVEDMQRYIGTSIGVKQFLDSEEQDHVAYYSLTRSKARITEVLESGFLGSLEAVLTTISGGFVIKISDLESHKLVEQLGLKVKTVERGGAEGEPDKFVLTPVLPFWMKANVSYEAGDTLVYEERQGKNITGETSDSDRPVFLEEFDSVNWDTR